MIERIYILCLIIIIESEVWTITHCLGLGHETMVCAVCLSVFLSFSVKPCACKDSLYIETRPGFNFLWLYQTLGKRNITFAMSSLIDNILWCLLSPFGHHAASRYDSDLKGSNAFWMWHLQCAWNYIGFLKNTKEFKNCVKIYKAMLKKKKFLHHFI